MSADGTDRRPISRNAADLYPVWSPDGSEIAFTRHGASSPPKTYVIPLDGGRASFVTNGVVEQWKPQR